MYQNLGKLILQALFIKIISSGICLPIQHKKYNLFKLFSSEFGGRIITLFYLPNFVSIDSCY